MSSPAPTIVISKISGCAAGCGRGAQRAGDHRGPDGAEAAAEVDASVDRPAGSCQRNAFAKRSGTNSSGSTNDTPNTAPTLHMYQLTYG